MSKNPSLLAHIISSALQELHSWRALVRADWRWLFLLIFGVVILVLFSRPLPPSDIYLAVGQSGSTFEVLGKKFVPYFEKEGITLHLVNTHGSVESLADVNDKNNSISATLMTGGITEDGSFPELRSLGSIEYVPLWLFYSGPEYTGSKPFAYFADKKVSIGPVDSASEVTLNKILSLSALSIDGRSNLLRMGNKEGIAKLLAGQIDAVCIMDGINGSNIQELLAHPQIHLLNFSYASAYVKKMPHMSVVTIPKGSLDLSKLHPAEDIQMLASTVTLVVKKDMHPAVQSIFLMAAEKISKNLDQFFAKPEYFPAYIDHSIQISPEAEIFYSGSRIDVLDRLPIWLASYIDRMWFVMLGLLAVIFPLYQLIPGYRKKHSVMLIEDAYDEIQQIDQKSALVKSEQEYLELLAQLDELDAESRSSWISSEEKIHLYTMKAHVNLVRVQILSRLEKLRANHSIMN